MAKLAKYNTKINKKEDDVVKFLNSEIKMFEIQAVQVIYFAIIFIGGVFLGHIYTALKDKIPVQVFISLFAILMSALVGYIIRNVGGNKSFK